MEDGDKEMLSNNSYISCIYNSVNAYKRLYMNFHVVIFVSNYVDEISK